MIMIPGTGTIDNYGSYISNCQKNQWPYRIPVNSLSDAQLYINIGATPPETVQYQLIHTCGALAGTIESITPGSYIVAQDTNGNYYGVFKNFTGATPTCFVIGITLTFEGESGDQIYFSEEYCVENCQNLILIKGCYGNLDNLLSYDSAGLYFGTGTAAIGDATLVYKHELLLREVEVYRSAIKNTFKQGRTRNFRTEKEKIYQFNAEAVPDWYLDEVDAVFYRGEVFVNGVKYLVNETQFELIEECKKLWKIPATFRDSHYQSFSCETDPCAGPVTECCDPEIISASVEEVPFEDFPPEESGGSGDGGGGSDVVIIQSVVDGVPYVTGTFDVVTGITDGSLVITCDAFANVRVFVERGSIHIPGIDPGDGSNYYTKNFADNFITFNTPLVSGELIYIETIP